MKKYLFLIIGLFSVLTLTSQNINIKGIVSDQTGFTMPGVTVQVKNESTIGTVSDLDGHYHLTVPANSILIFSYIGFAPQQLKVSTKDEVLNVVLKEETEAIDEVVVTAIGIRQQKKKLGYTTQQVNTGALEQPGTINVGNALSGQVAGLTVNNPTGIFQAPSFTLRGKTPLMVIDGVPVESDLFDVSAENIASINVLKGTAAAALYGARGKDGAILISTKSA
ncbi:MAG: carboxypeptidase-like regulatory domain-containing protein, partial [Bacteroidales bacterium]